jgi:hypothetical protein
MASQNAETVVQNTENDSQLNLSDLVAICAIINRGTEAGLYKSEELVKVGTVFTKCYAFVKAAREQIEEKKEQIEEKKEQIEEKKEQIEEKKEQIEEKI